MKILRSIVAALALAAAAPALAGDVPPPPSWEDAGHLPPLPPPLPRPIEPDAPNHGPLRIDRPAPPPPPPPPPAAYELADAQGQRWRHADPGYLQRFVAERNARMFAPTLIYRGSACSSGSCPR